MKALHAVAFILVIVGGLNWLLVGFDFNLVTYLVSFLGSFGSILEKVVYILVGLSAVYLVVTHKKDCVSCQKDGMMDSPKM